MTIAVEEKTGQGLVSEDLFNRLVSRIQEEHSIDYGQAAAIMDQALAFLGTCAVTTERLSPSAQVDIGWHTFILYTRHYREFCDRAAGRFIDHEPNDSDENKGGRGASVVTTDAIRKAGYAVDLDLWTAPSAKCNDGEKCRASGNDGNENTDTNDPDKR
ncbi:glycine-rich domain-containing protein [Amycolatopsis sp. cmx-11-32]|uniref:glycine-rich domain-containing protein n=1 Tax=Amycolatopsis sp. cmx-11-32 TaxID=2785796 RepID=UPI0039E6460E